MWVKVIPAVRLPRHLNELDYAVPAHLAPDLRPHQLVKIPLRNKTHFGIVSTVFPDEPAKPLKPITDIIHPEPALLSAQLHFLEHTADLYHVSLGFLLKTALFSLQKRKLERFQKTSLPSLVTPTTIAPCTSEITQAEQLAAYFANTLSLSHQHLIIVPEISEIEAIIALLPKKFSDQIVIVHSDIKPTIAFQNWLDIRSNQKSIIIGTRLAFFAPFANLAHIFLWRESSEEHKNTDMAPRFHNRDAALLLAHYWGSELHLLSASLSVESYFWQHKKIFTPAALFNTPKTIDYEIANMNTERRLGNHLFSQATLDALHHSSRHTFLFVYQRGSGKNTLCSDCGQLFRCPVCSLPITWYKTSNKLLCHHCAYSQPMIETCPKCHSINLKTYGLGSESITQAVQQLFPQSERTIESLDSLSSAPKKNTHLPHPLISIGTQAAWSKVDWSTLDTMVFVDADTPLFIPDYQSAERVWHQIHDAHYRLHPTARLIIQTAHPDHSVFRHFFKPQLFYQTELKQRYELRYPPYSFLIKIFAKFMSLEAADLESQKIYEQLIRLTKNDKNITIIPTQEKKNSTGIWKIITIKIAHPSPLPPRITYLNFLPSNWKVDPHPNSLLRV